MQAKLQARGSKVLALCATPGVASTQLQHTSTQQGYGKGAFLGIIMRGAQSEEDGTMPLLHCTFEPSLKSGDLVTPRNKGLFGWMTGDGWTGPPTIKEPEPLGAEQDVQDLLWRESEKAVGPFFRDASAP